METNLQGKTGTEDEEEEKEVEEEGEEGEEEEEEEGEVCNELQFIAAPSLHSEFYIYKVFSSLELLVEVYYAIFIASLVITFIHVRTFFPPMRVTRIRTKSKVNVK